MPAAAAEASAATPAFLPVLVGGDIGTYALARAFHEAYGVRPVVVSEAMTGPIAHSGFLDVQVVTMGAAHDRVADALVEVARRLRARHGDTLPLLLLSNSDWYVESIAAERERLEPWYRIAAPSLETFELVGDKESFNRLALAAGMRVPETVVVDLSDADRSDWHAPEIGLRFPVVAKPALSSYYLTVHFAGKKKVYPIDAPEQLNALWKTLRTGGFRGTFLVQELIPGGDDTVRSATAYVDRRGAVTLLASARVLLEDHTPQGLGIPVAMYTTAMPEILDPVRRFLEAVDYHGFANFDVKTDPRDGTPYFFEVNPRIGRNNYYVTGAGTNAAVFPVADLVEGRRLETVTVEREALYTTVPNRLLRRYLAPEERATVDRLLAAKAVTNPIDSPQERAWRRRLYVAVARANHWRKFRRFYPEPTDTGF